MPRRLLRVSITQIVRCSVFGGGIGGSLWYSIAYGDFDPWFQYALRGRLMQTA